MSIRKNVSKLSPQMSITANFLRFKIDETSGELTIYPVGVERVVKSWKDGDKKKGEPTLVPDPLKPENEAFLIEEPIVFVKPFAAGDRTKPVAKSEKDSRQVRERTLEEPSGQTETSEK